MQLLRPTVLHTAVQLTTENIPVNSANENNNKQYWQVKANYSVKAL